MQRYVDCDFETVSRADLKVVGARKYAEHPSTDVLCLHIHLDGGNYTWASGDNSDLLKQCVDNKSIIFVAHNAGFEQAIWECIMVPRYGFPPLPPERWEDTMAMAAWKSLPLKLEKGAQALGLPIEKDMEGNRLTLSMSRVDKKTGELPERTPEKLERISRYCAQDVAVEAAMRKRIGLLSEQSPQERKVWLYDQRINQRGVRIDLDFVRQAQLVIERASTPLLVEFRDLTGGVNPGQVAKVIEWAKGQGVELENLQKGYLETLLGAEEAEDFPSLAAEDDNGCVPSTEPTLSENDVQGSGPLPTSVRRVLEIRQMLGSASIKKLARMQACAGEDGRVRGMLQYHAAHPGRWGGRLLQPQNFPRGTVKADPAFVVQAIMTGDPEFVEMVLGAPAIECVASALRHALIPDPGKVFLVGDYAGIEARIVLAMAGQHDKTALMAAGEDVYLDMASVIYGEKVTNKEDPRRHAGKGGVLGCGFQCGPANFNIKFLGGSDLPLAEKTVGAYRKEWAPEVPRLWYALDDAALKAARGRPTEVHGVSYRLEDGWLTARLPSGWQKIWYFDPRLGRDDRFDRECWLYSSWQGGKHEKKKAYGGLLCLAGDTLVLTQNGFMPLVKVQVSDLLWDGSSWVSHEGVVAQGVKETINFGGVNLTPDHKVLTDDGWKPAADSSYHRAVAVCEALGNAAGWDARRQSLPWIEPRPRELMARYMRLRARESRHAQRLYPWRRDFLRMQHRGVEVAFRDEAPNTWDDFASGICGVAGNDRPLPSTDASGLAQLRRSGNFSLREVEQFREFLERYGADLRAGADAGSDRQLRQLRAGQLPLDDHERADKKPPAEKRVVYDILNAGPNRRFTVAAPGGRNFIVSNCENAVQGLARGLLCAAIDRLERAGMPVVLTVHDEIVCEVDEGSADQRAFEQAMAEPTRWARDMKIPVAVEAWQGDRYRK